ncbi:MAG: tat pathway signal sequence [Desulfovibrionaceae bacterium]
MNMCIKRAMLVALPVMMLVFASVTYAQMQGNPADGAALYEGCVPCHTLMGKGIAGQPEGQLVSKMTAIQNGSFTNPKAIEMQNVLKPMSPQQILDLAAYITGM